MELLTGNLYKPVLITPAIDGADTLKIVSGFASPAIALKHLHDLREQNKSVSIDLVFGMAKNNGVEMATHKGFMKIQKSVDSFRCHYSYKDTPIHAKVYTWCKGEKPLLCYTGSANYTNNGFRSNLQREVMTQTDAKAGLKFFYDSYDDTVNCVDEPIVQARIALYESDKPRKNKKTKLETVELTLLDSRTGDTHERAGLNWGQRKGRDRDQAYIPVPSQIAKSPFFPPKDEYFTVLTDSGFSFTAKVAQDGRKAIHSSDSNAIIGRYFRERLGVRSEQYVTRRHLENYGRTTVTFTKIDDETYMMDFSPRNDKVEKETS